MLRIELSTCNVKDMENLYGLAHLLAHYFPKPEHCLTGIFELLINAVEHGNLGIGYARKSELILNGLWREEVERRLSLPEHRYKKIYVTLIHTSHECTLEIADEGDGFAWADYIGKPVNLRNAHGRGLPIVFSSAFDNVAFNSKGNIVTCSASYARSAIEANEQSTIRA